MNKVIIFDYDDTLVRSKEHHLKILSNIYGDLFSACSAKLAEILPLTTEGLYEFLVTNECETNTFETFKAKFNESSPDKTEIFPWVPRLLEDLKSENYDLVICSYNDLSKIEQNLRRLGIRHYFKLIFTPASGFSKFKSNIFQHLSKDYIVKKFRSVLIGDSASDQRLAQNSGIGYIDVQEIQTLSDQDRLDKVLTDVREVDASESKSTLEENLILAQYTTLRNELMNLQEAEEKTYSTTLLATGAIFSAMLTIIFTKEVSIYTGLVFLFPAFYTLTSLSKYLTNGLRAANISSFIAINYSQFFPSSINWELKIGQFSSNAKVKEKINLSSVFETAFVYRFIIYTSMGVSLIVTIFSFCKNFLRYSNHNLDFSKELLPVGKWPSEILNHAYPYLSLVDLVIVVTANILVFWHYRNGINDPKKKMPYPEKKRILNELWSELP